MQSVVEKWKTMSIDSLVEFRVSRAKHISGIYRDSFNHRANHEWYIVVAIVGAILLGKNKIMIEGWLPWLPIGIGSLAVIVYLFSLHSRNRMDKEKAERAEDFITNPIEKKWDVLVKIVSLDEGKEEEIKGKEKKKKEKQSSGKVKDRFLYKWKEWIHIAVMELLIMICTVLIVA